jgi:hypothetical protein
MPGEKDRRELTMAEADEWLRARVSRRTFLRGAAAAAATGPILLRKPGFAAVTPPTGAHIAFGADPRTQTAISWLTSVAVSGAVLDLGLDATDGLTVEAETRTVAGTPTVYHHVLLDGLQPATTYHYRLRHDGGAGTDETFRTAPAASEAFRFTAFGDQGANATGASTLARVMALDPAFHFHVGDLCYANPFGVGNPAKPADLSVLLQSRYTNQPVWDNWFKQNAPQAARAAWMPTTGNHEMEYGYGPLGYDGYLARFTLPGNGAAGAPVTYAFRYGNVGVVALDGNDASDEIRSNRDYTGGAQETWLEATLASMRTDPAIDFIVAGYHYCSYCTNVVHGSDGGVRGRWGPLFDQYSVDLVINGHNHCYERTHPIRDGVMTREALSNTEVEAAVDGTTYITAGGGGQVAYQTSLYPVSTTTLLGVRVPETAEWSAFRYLDLSLLAVDVTPRVAGRATMTVQALKPNGDQLETLTLVRRA